MRKLLILCTLMLSFSAFSLDISEAKEQGLIGEQTDGLLGIVEMSPEVAALVKDINTRRLEKYALLAEENGMSLEQVSSLAGKKTIKKTPVGQYIKNASAQWVVK